MFNSKHIIDGENTNEKMNKFENFIDSLNAHIHTVN